MDASKKIAEKTVINLNIDYLPKVNLALQQNAIPVIRSITIDNILDCELKNVTCYITSTPAFFEPITKTIDVISGQSHYVVDDIIVKLNYQYLAELSERINGQIQVRISTAPAESATEKELLLQSYPVTIFTFDEWFGSEVLPDILAAFVTPNLDIISQLQRRIAQLLKEKTGNSAVDGYQSKDKKRIYTIIEAAYKAVAEQSINYANPPASFGKNGQRIRFADAIFKFKLATCLDLSLLFAGLLEQCGLNPLILLHQGHSYVGCHLTEYHFPDSLQDDLQSVRKCVELDEIVVFEATTATASNAISFRDSELTGKKHLILESQFIGALDIRQARILGLRPLPLKRSADGLVVVDDDLGMSPKREINSKADRAFRAEIEIEQNEDKRNRVTGWQQKLLDLTLRNRLLNFRETKQTIPIAFSDLGVLEDKLAAGTQFAVNPATQLLSGTDPRDLFMLERQTGEDPLTRYLSDEFGRKRLRSYLSEGELYKRLLGLYRQARTDIEEGGVNTLFLSLGFLEWKESPAATQVHQAPLLLLPVKLERKSVQEGFTLERADDDTVINVTLLELLRRDYGKVIPGIDPLPTDDYGVDVQKVFQLVQQAVKDLRGWEVRCEIWLGSFSFNKFIMWNDLNNRLDDLQQNPVVNHLVNNAGSDFDDGIESVMPENLELAMKYDRLFCPLSADSSQLSAVLSAERGKNFVLHGPPGTGKSQTITNLIAHCLTVGKKVLFVAEKRAALEVVHHRLCTIGLRPFCLELHSNKGGKREVLAQFKESLDFIESHEPANWGTITKELEDIRINLNSYVAELHHNYPNGLSVYQVFSYLISHEKDERLISGVNELSLQQSTLKISAEELGQMRSVIAEMASCAEALSDKNKTDFFYIRHTDWSPQWVKEAVTVSEELIHACTDLADSCKKLFLQLGYMCQTWSESDIYNMAVLAEKLKDAPNLPDGFIGKGWGNFVAEVESLINNGLILDELREELCDFELDKILGLNIDGIRERLQNNAGKFFPIRFFYNRSLLAELKPLKKIGGTKLKLAELKVLLDKFELFISSNFYINSVPPELTARLGAWWNNGNSDWEKFRRAIVFGNRVNDAIIIVSNGNAVVLNSMRLKVGELLSQADKLLGKNCPMRKQINTLIQGWNNFQDALGNFIDKLDIAPEFKQQTDILARSSQYANGIIRNSQYLRHWSLWLKSRQKAAEFELDTLINASESGTLEPEYISLAFEKRFREKFINEVIGQVPVLRDFLGAHHDRLVERFIQLNKSYADLSQKLTISRIAAQMPHGRRGQCPAGTELGTLKREIEKRARNKAVRLLLEGIPTILPSLKPCLLMSPLSVAQYLPPDQSNFDIVVFDEASQIPVWDAIGAIARGKQLIVVGDPKQLPPTNFFQRQNDDNESEENEIEDLESILDECIVSGIDESHLRWHYRSHHESLIAFSNYHYYDNRLLTFPAAKHGKHLGLKYHLVSDGLYDRCKSRTNKKEAQHLVDHLVKRLLAPECANPSIGIVTFSQAQKILIEDLLDDARRKYPAIEKLFQADITEPIFVKNLENVQGDERNIIYFSICYGPDENGKISMNFGPINRAGGERRLNVAITRAKEQIIIFSSINSSQIDLSRTSATGAKHLKLFLDYAEKGAAHLTGTIQGTSYSDYDSCFEREVAEFLRGKGYLVHDQVGCSGYSIDLAITLPDKPGHYVLGIECDGAAYHSFATANDRDQLRRLVLEERLGWRIHRVWSTSWWHDRDRTQEQLIAAVENALSEPETLPQSSSTTEKDSFQDIPKIDIDQEGLSEPAESDCSVQASLTCEFAQVYQSVPQQHKYRQEDFYETWNRKRIREQMIRIIESEGPITEALLRKRVVKEWRFNRTGNTILEVLESSYPRYLAKTRQFGQKVFWPEYIEPLLYQFFRYPDEDASSKRIIEDIPLHEISNAMRSILTKYHSCPQDILFRETAKKLGFGRVTAQSRKFYSAALNLLQQSGVVG